MKTCARVAALTRMLTLAGLFTFLPVLLLAGCDFGKSGDASGAGDSSASASGGEDETEDLSPEEKEFVAAAKPFAAAIAARNYAEAYAQLSSHGKARMSVNQFLPADEDAQFEKNEQQAMQNVDAATFAQWMQKVEAEHGAPAAIDELSVYSTDAAVLARKSTEEFGAMDAMFAIGAMPESIPADIRRASIRGQIRTKLSPEQLAAAAKELEMTVEELQNDEEFAPYFTLKTVLVEEAGQLRVGYFEILPPGLLD